MANEKKEYKKAEQYDYCEGVLFEIRRYQSNITKNYHAEIFYRDPNTRKVLAEVKACGETQEMLENKIKNKSVHNLAKKCQSYIKNNTDLTLYAFWILFKNDIISEYDWGKRKAKDYDYIVNKLALPLGIKPLKRLTTEDYFKAADCALENSNKSTKSPEKKKEEYMDIMYRLCKYASIVGVLPGPNPLENYQSAKRSVKSPESNIRSRFYPGCIDKDIQAKILHKTIDNIEKGGEYLGVALLLLTGATEQDVCGLNYGDIHTYENGTSSLLIKRQYSKAKGEKKAHMDIPESSNVYRAISICNLLDNLIERRKNGCSFKTKKNLPMVCEGNKHRCRLTPDKLARFAVDMLVEAGLEERTVGAIVISQKAEVFRKNFSFRMYKEGMSEDEINYITGKALKDTVSQSYIDFLNMYAQTKLKSYIDGWVHNLLDLSEV